MKTDGAAIEHRTATAAAGKRGLEAEEIRTLAAAARAGDASARERLVLACAPLALNIARMAWRGPGSGLEVDDLQSEAMVYVLGAVDSYDPARGPLMGWVRLCVKGRVVRAATRARTLVSGPRSVLEANGVPRVLQGDAPGLRDLTYQEADVAKGTPFDEAWGQMLEGHRVGLGKLERERVRYLQTLFCRRAKKVGRKAHVRPEANGEYVAWLGVAKAEPAPKPASKPKLAPKPDVVAAPAPDVLIAGPSVSLADVNRWRDEARTAGAATIPAVQLELVVGLLERLQWGRA